MATLYFVRHGKPASAFDADLDPGLDALGHRQAEAVAEELAPRGPLPIYSSPLARARQSAEPLSTRWKRAALVEPRVAELPSPTDALAERARFVRQVMTGGWAAAGAELQAWRQALIDWVSGRDHNCVVFSHFIAINAIVGAATGVDRVIVFHPDHASITRCAVEGGRIELEGLGREADTGVR